MKIILLLLYLSCYTGFLAAQVKPDSTGRDTADSKVLQNVIITSFNQNRKLTEVPSAISFIGQTQLNRLSDNSILASVNAIPGVRMEERSPGSFRFNIRGSSLRSPFGVRDVKVYFNEFPLTDPGGNTYLNQLGFYNYQSVEIIKGPAGSMYGAGTGGAVLIRSMPLNFQKGIDVNYTAASFNNNQVGINIRLGKPGNQTVIGYSHQYSSGYRQQSALRRDVACWESLFKINDKQTVHAFVLYADLYYQTPGALTKTEFMADPRQARPSIGTTPGAVQNKAAIFQKNFTSGFSHEIHFSSHWQNTTAVYGAFTDFSNPGIRVYEKRKEPHFGGRSVFQFNNNINENKLQLNIGVEAQKGFFNTKDFRNKSGEIDTLQTDDDIDSWLYTLFAQADLKLKNGWIITAGSSINRSSVTFTRLSKSPVTKQQRTFENKIAPRIALLKKITPHIAVYATASRGFSQPAVSELLHSNGIVGNELQPGDGVDYELGARGLALKNKLQFDISAFYLRLKNTIVQRIDGAGVFYYVNAGSTRQQGIEAALQYEILDKPSGFISNINCRISYTNHNFHYRDFRQVNNDYSDKQLPGVAPVYFVGGLDLLCKTGVYLNLAYTYSDPLPLNDANTDFAGSYQLLGFKAGCKKIKLLKLRMEIFTGIDNLTNTRYSLGNDINAAAGRYYNAAPGINYYAGIGLHF